MKRLSVVLVLSGLASVLTPATASAQPNTAFAPPVFAPVIYPPQRQYSSWYQYNSSINVPLFIGNVSINRSYYGSYYSSGYGYGGYPSMGYSYPAVMPSAYGGYGYSSGYGSGYGAVPSTGYGNNYLQQMQRDLARAQSGLYPQGAYSSGGYGSSQPSYGEPSPGAAAPAPAAGPTPAPKKTDEGRIITGDTLNELLDAVTKVEATGAKGPAPFVPPGVLADVRYAGSPNADLLDLVRQADAGMKYPQLFGKPGLKPLMTDLLTDFAPVVTTVKAGKAPLPKQVTKVEDSFHLLRAAATPRLKDLSPDEAAHVRKFLDRFASAIGALKAGAGAALVEPKWLTEGTSVSDLVKHMNRYKLRFGPAPSGGEETYLTLQRDFEAYLFMLNESKKK